MPNIWKPVFGSPIIKGHPLADGLVGCWLFNEGSGDKVYDISGHDNHGALTNMEPDTDWVGSEQGWALDFDGTDEYIVVSAPQSLIDLPTTYNFTVVAWYNADLAGTGPNSDALIAWEGADDFILYPNDAVSAGSGGTRIFWRDLGGTIIDEAGSDLTGTWHQFVFVSRASNDHEAYRDGVSVGTSSDTGAAGPFSDLRIATYRTSAQQFAGQIANLSIYERAISDDEIAYLNAFPFCFIDQGEMDWLNMLGVVEEDIIIPIHLLMDRVLGGI